MNLIKILTVCETEGCMPEGIIDDGGPNDKGYPWKGAVICGTVLLVFVFVFAIPWVYGAFRIIQKLLS